jgi:hypothetical protein
MHEPPIDASGRLAVESQSELGSAGRNPNLIQDPASVLRSRFRLLAGGRPKPVFGIVQYV